VTQKPSRLRTALYPTFDALVKTVAYTGVTSSSAVPCPLNLLGALFISRLLLPPLIADDTLTGTLWRLGFRLRHAFLTTMFAALVLHTLEVIFFWHRSPTLA
jgi:hypothetical protein